MLSPLPFKRGTTQSAPGLEGSIYYDHVKKQWLQIVKNTDGSALNSKRVVKWEDPKNYEVDEAATAADGPNVAGVVDPELGSNTVAVNKHFYIVQKGICTVAKGSGAIAMATDSLVRVAGAAVSQGKVAAITGGIKFTAGGTSTAADAADILAMAMYDVGVSHFVGSAALLANVEVMLDVRGAP